MGELGAVYERGRGTSPAPPPTHRGRAVDARRERSFGEILAEWDDVGPQVAAFADDFPGRLGNQFTDVTVHDHDLRGALDRAGSRDSDGVRIGADFVVNVFLHPGVTALGLGPLEVRAGDRTWVVGTGESPTEDIGGASRADLMSTEVIPEPTVTRAGTLDVDEFELLRALTGRRSAAQIGRYEWSVDAEPYLPIFGLGPFTIRSTDLSE